MLGNRRNRATIGQSSLKKSEDEDEYNTTLVNENSDYCGENDDEEYSKSSNKKKTTQQQKSQHVIKGLNAQELRRFIRSYRKFPSPLSRIDMIAQDSHLEEKSQACLIEFAKRLQTLCKTTISEYETNASIEIDQSSSDKNQIVKKKETERGPSFNLNGVKLNAHQILEAETYFQPITHYIKDQDENKT